MNSKRLLCFLLGAALILQTPATAYAAETLTYEQYRGGSGYSSTIKEQDYAVIEISTEEDLRKLVENCVLDSWSRDKKVVLQNDIVLSMTGELSIPTFAGIFDGSGFTISNVKLTGDGSAVGLFRYVQEGAKVRNLTVTGEVSPSGSQDQVGGIVGVNIMVATQRYEDYVRAAVQAGTDCIISGAGLPLDLPGVVAETENGMPGRSHRTMLAPIVSSPRALSVVTKYWMKKYDRKPDFLVAEGPLAGGHLGFKREELDAYYAAVRYFKAHLEGKRYNPKKLTEEKGQLTEEVASHKAALEAVQADVRILRDVRHWLNQVLPSDQYRQTAEPGKKKSTIGELKGREQRIREERAEKKLPPRTQKQQDMEH